MDIARQWRQQPSNLRFLGSRCSSCEALLFPKHIRCPKCGSKEIASFQFKGGGSVLSLTTVYEAPRGFAGQVPYIAGLIRLDEGPVITAMLTDMDPDQARIGMRVEMVTRRIRCDSADSPILYGYKFVPEEISEQCDQPTS
ncbi:MAG: Zn-ribbon domain-containing OB-fold protein [Proteobacteria bacterium]|nr:Zn-ribbon domain-containing OB-fold protein [Pseudomonadota bacterium]